MDPVAVVRVQLLLAAAGAGGAASAFLSGLLLKGYLRLPLPKRFLLSLHRSSAWSTLGLYLVLAVSCLGFHFPFDDPRSVFDLGWFVVHPLAGPAGAVLYGGKVVTVRRLRKGWMLPGLLWGTGLFLFWAFQFGTVVPSFSLFSPR